MDLWDFKKWRKQLGYTQAVAAEKLGLSRGAIQYWESEVRPVPLAVELACRELLRLWRQRPDYGPVTLLYSADPIGQDTSASSGSIVLRSERHPNNEDALRSAARLAQITPLFAPLIVEDDGIVVWSGPELLGEFEVWKMSGHQQDTR